MGVNMLEKLKQSPFLGDDIPLYREYDRPEDAKL
jgi:hypothetical protein